MKYIYQILLLSTTMKSGEGCQNITPRIRHLNSYKTGFLYWSWFFLLLGRYIDPPPSFSIIQLLEISIFHWGMGVKISGTLSACRIKIYWNLHTVPHFLDNGRKENEMGGCKAPIRFQLFIYNGIVFFPSKLNYLTILSTATKKKKGDEMSRPLSKHTQT